MPVITKHNVLDIKNVVFGEGTPKICLPIVDTTIKRRIFDRCIRRNQETYR